MKCPHCGSTDVTHRAYSEAVHRSVYMCNDCRKRFRADDDGVRGDGGRQLVADGGVRQETATQQTTSQIRDFAESIDDPENWRILVPADDFDRVKDQLDTEYDVGTYYEGIALCYTQHHDEARVEFKANLSEVTDRGE